MTREALAALSSAETDVPAEVVDLAHARQEARSERDWARADSCATRSRRSAGRCRTRRTALSSSPGRPADDLGLPGRPDPPAAAVVCAQHLRRRRAPAVRRPVLARVWASGARVGRDRRGNRTLRPALRGQAQAGESRPALHRRARGRQSPPPAVDQHRPRRAVCGGRVSFWYILSGGTAHLRAATAGASSFRARSCSFSTCSTRLPCRAGAGSAPVRCVCRAGAPAVHAGGRETRSAAVARVSRHAGRDARPGRGAEPSRLDGPTRRSCPGFGAEIGTLTRAAARGVDRCGAGCRGRVGGRRGTRPS